MIDALIRIKRLVLAQRVIFTSKAESEMYADGLTYELVFDAIINSPVITNTLRSRNPHTGCRETLYVIKGLTFDALTI
jgi:hypothetical protein